MSHYSVKKGAFFMGFGLSNVVLVKSDKHGRMIPEALDAAIEESKKKGFTPLMVNGTSGTTVMGAYDPLNEIADVCERQGNIWLHVDACWGGAALLSLKLRHKMKGIERADSIAWDPHKMAGAILQCAVLITKHKDLLAEAHTAGARYLFQQDKVYDCSYDTGDKSVQCGRKIDAFKLWLLWKAYGSSGMAERIESCFDNALYLRQLLTETPGFRLLFEEQECTNTCFWYIPPSMRGQVAPAIKGQMQVTGSMMIGYQPQGQFVNFFRMIVASPMTTREDMQHVISTIQRHGQNL
ncbi:hypothetical protein EB796_011466 [Bugula neritina]|uniref:CSAD n=1 Tax=Bugula neritina TaxID=10212 RepID=A0A7J7JY05_BUGNE|nr:hypothetical protein EB796_011466 [Bugula neritina]